MARNIEIKATIRDLNKLRGRAAALSQTPGELIPQEDTFFKIPKGRLKLRVLAPDHGQLIHYERDDASGPKTSEYFISTTAEPEILKKVLSTALVVRGVVRKQRWLYWVGNTRIHLDEVEGLGSFLELEVLLSPNQSPEEGEAIAVELMAKLGIREEDLIKGAYMDLLENQGPL